MEPRKLDAGSLRCPAALVAGVTCLACAALPVGAQAAPPLIAHFPAPPSPPASCEGEACQGTPSPPNDPTPASAAFQGAGNVKESTPTPCRKGQRKVRKAGKSRCVTRHTKQKQGRKQKRRAGADRRNAR